MRSSSPASPSPSPRLRSLSSSVSLPRTYSPRGQKRPTVRPQSPDDDADADGASPSVPEHSPQPRGKRARPSPSSQVLVKEDLGNKAGKDSAQIRVETSTKRLSRPESGDESSANDSERSVPGPSTVPPLRPKSPTTPRASRFRTDATPKDLSSLFPSPSRGSPASSPFRSPSRAHSSGGRRQMLTKTQSLGQSLKARSTESSPSSLVQRTRSMPDTPSKSVEYEFPRRLQLFANIPSSVLDSDMEQPRSGGAKRTYGSKRTVREVRQDSVEREEDDTELNIGATSYADLRKRYEVTNPVPNSANGDDDGTDPLIARPPEVVSDMRSKGENRRFIDEIDYLLEGLSDARTPLSIRRASSMDILAQVQDEDWLARALVCGQIERLWESLWIARGEGDVILDIISGIFIATLATSELSFDSFVASHEDELRAMLIQILKRPLAEYKALASKKTLSEKLSERVQALGMQSSTVELASWQLACFLLAKMVVSINSSSDAIPRTKLLSSLMSVLSESTNALLEEKNRRKEQASPLLLSHLSIVSNCLDTAASLVTDDASCLRYLLSRASKWSESLCQLAQLCLIRDETALGGDAQRVWVIYEHICHLLALLATISPEWASAILHEKGLLEALATQAVGPPPSKGPAPDDRPTNDDDDAQTAGSNQSGPDTPTNQVLCMVMAILFGLITQGPSETSSHLARIRELARMLNEGATEVVVAETGHSCTRDGKCRRQCTCTTSKRCFDVSLAQAYSTQVSTSSTTTESHAIVAGYMAVLITSFLAGGSKGRRCILSALPGEDDKAKVNGLRQCIKGLTGLQDLALHGLSSQGDGPRVSRAVGREVEDYDEETVLEAYMSQLDELYDIL